MDARPQFSKLKKETQFNKKLSLNEQAIKLKKEIDELKKVLNKN